MTTQSRIAQIEKNMPKAKEQAAQVVIYKMGEDVNAMKSAHSGTVIFIPDNGRDMQAVRRVPLTV